ncbi:U32 family peptidase [Desulfitobacterium sp. AusDCA]
MKRWQWIGITSLKIMGREASPRKKVENVELLKKMLAYQGVGHTPDEVRDYARLDKEVNILCESRYMCYER